MMRRFIFLSALALLLALPAQMPAAEWKQLFNGKDLTAGNRSAPATLRS